MANETTGALSKASVPHHIRMEPMGGVSLYLLEDSKNDLVATTHDLRTAQLILATPGVLAGIEQLSALAKTISLDPGVDDGIKLAMNEALRAVNSALMVARFSPVHTSRV